MSAIFTHMSSILHAFVRCIRKSCTLDTRILCRHKRLKNFSTRDLPNGAGTECPSLWYSGQSRRGRTCRRVRTDMTQSQHAPMYYTACTACRTPQWAAQYTPNEWHGQWLTWDLLNFTGTASGGTLHTQPTRCMCVCDIRCVWGGGNYGSSTPQQLMSRIKGRRIQRHM